MVSKRNDNTTLFIVIAIFAFAIIMGTIIGSSYNKTEKFGNNNKLVYLYMDGCGHCNDFNTVWSNIKSKIDSNKVKYSFSAEKYNLNDNSSGSNYSKTYDIQYAPAILFIKDGVVAKNEYNGSRTVDGVLQWAEKQNNN
jgi:hypothetical protein